MLFSHELVFTLVPGSMQVTYKKYLILITYLSKIYITEYYFTGSSAEKWKTKTHKDKLTSRSTVVFSLVLVPSPMQLNYEKNIWC